MFNTFDFRVLRENRRVVKDESGNAARQAELENFHRVLMNVSEGKATQRVRDFIVNAYVRGALSTGGQVENVALEGSTAVYTKRRYRDRYNRAIVKRVAKHHNHSLKEGIFYYLFLLGLRWGGPSQLAFIKKRPQDQSAHSCKRCSGPELV